MCFKIDWASLIVARKFIVFVLFYFVFEGNFQVQAPWGAYIWRGNLTEGFLHYEFGGLIFEGAYYTWRGLFSEFCSIPPHIPKVTHTYTVLIISSNKQISPLGGNTPKINFPRNLILVIHI